MARSTRGGGGGNMDKPLPDLGGQRRPGTAGTEAALETDRRRASERLRQAQQAERAYKAAKRSATAHANFSEARVHFRQAGHHLRRGVSLTFSVVRNVPYILRGKRDHRRNKAGEAEGQPALTKRVSPDDIVTADATADEADPADGAEGLKEHEEHYHQQKSKGKEAALAV